jgi:hypothetical protein
MNDRTMKEAVGDWHRATAQEVTQHRHDTKIGRVLAELKRRSLNRFEAEREVGDHALNSTIAVLRAEGYNILDRWEEVPTRFGKSARVKRYSYVGGRHA